MDVKEVKFVKMGNHEQLIKHLRDRGICSNEAAAIIIERGDHEEIMALLYRFWPNEDNVISVIERGVHQEIMKTLGYPYRKRETEVLIKRGNHLEVMQRLSERLWLDKGWTKNSVTALIKRDNSEKIIAFIKRVLPEGLVGHLSQDEKLDLITPFIQSSSKRKLIPLLIEHSGHEIVMLLIEILEDWLPEEILAVTKRANREECKSLFEKIGYTNTLNMMNL